MKTKILSPVVFLLGTAFTLVYAGLPGTAFTYQGRLTDSGAPANGSYVFRFSLDNGNNTPVATPIVVSPVGVTNGLFTVTLDFGPGIFTNAARNLNIEVHTNDNGSSFVQLSPSQPILPTPYAIYAETADAAGIVGVLPAASLSGSYGSALSLINPNNLYAGNGGGLTNVNAASLAGLNSASFWQITGNAGTTAGPNFLGTTDNQPLELRANGQRVLRLDSSGSVPNLIGGHAANSIAPGLSGVTIAGGGDAASFNSVNSSWGTVSGGSGNTIAASASAGTISGGANNLVANNAGLSTINGGFGNIVSATHAAIGGGEQNWIKPLADHSTIGGGYFNMNAGSYATLGGGAYNGIQANVLNGTISGGYLNVIQDGAQQGVIAGGGLNLIHTNAFYSTISGGQNNSVASHHVVLAGGENNSVGTDSDHATIGGGFSNMIQTNASGAAIAGGIANRIQTNAAYAASGGGASNQVGAVGGVIGGGRMNTNSGPDSFIGGGTGNTIQPSSGLATIGGGRVNTIQNTRASTIGGGEGNTILVEADNAAIGGGYQNRIEVGSDGAVIGGGWGNTIQTNGLQDTIGGGLWNTIQSSGGGATIGGGSSNTIQTNADSATIPGGSGAVARSYGQQAYASGTFHSAPYDPGPAQASLYVLRGVTTNATTTEIFLDGNEPFFASNRMNLPSSGLWAFDILVVAGRTDVKQDAGYQIKGIIGNVAGVTLVKGLDKKELWEDDASWDVSVEADSTHQALVIKVTGATGKNIRWVANVRTVEVIR